MSVTTLMGEFELMFIMKVTVIGIERRAMGANVFDGDRGGADKAGTLVVVLRRSNQENRVLVDGAPIVIEVRAALNSSPVFADGLRHLFVLGRPADGGGGAT